MSPLQAADDPNRPLVRALLANPAWRARYLAHVRTITNSWMDWKRIGPIFKKYHKLIDADVKRDRKRLYSYADFKGSLGGSDAAGAAGGRGRSTPLQSFVTERHRFLVNHASMKGSVVQAGERMTRSSSLRQMLTADSFAFPWAVVSLRC